MAEPLTLYKLIILYMLKKVDFPLTNAQISEFVLDQEYTTYFTLQQAISELVEAGLLRMETIRNTSQYYLTEDGDMTLGYFTQKISAPIREDIDRYIQENKMALRNEVAIVADYYKNTAGEYSVHCEVKEKKGDLLDLTISVPDKEQAIAMCNHWGKRCQEIYEYVMGTLLTELKSE